METSSLEARNIRFVNSNLSRVQESKLIPASWPQNIIRGKFGVELHQFHVFQTFYIDCQGQCKGLPPRIFIQKWMTTVKYSRFMENLEYFTVVIHFYLN